MRRWVLMTVTALLAAGCTTSPPAAAPRSSRVATPNPSVSGPARPPARLRVRQLALRLPRPVAREALAWTADPSRVLVAGGLLAEDVSSASTYTLDLRTGRSRVLHDLPTPVHDTAAATLAGATLVIGGGNASEQSVVQGRRGKRWTLVGHLPSARSDLAAPAGGGRVYVVGGYDGGSPALADVLVSADGKRWSTAARLPVPVRYAATALVGTSLWVFGGERNGSMVDAVQRVDLATGRARVVAHLRHVLGHAVVVRLGDRVLVVGGRTAPDRLTSRMWWFAPGSRRFSPAGRLPAPLADSAVVSRGRTAYLVGGETPALSDRVLRLRW